MAKEKPNSEILLEYLFAQILNAREELRGYANNYEIAAEILGEQFGEDEQILARLTKKTPIDPRINDGIIITLCQGWPNSKELNEIFETIQKFSIELRIGTVYRIISK